MSGATNETSRSADPTAAGEARRVASRPTGAKRKHPSHGARVVALVSSVTATVGVGAALGLADRAAASTAATASSVVPSTVATSASGTATGTAAAATVASTSSTYADGVYTGASEYTKWGNYQVRVTIQNGKIVSIVETQAPTDSRSTSINNRAQPVLESEAIAAQSANINAVSGATYTSTTYKASLQSALDHATKAAVATA